MLAPIEFVNKIINIKSPKREEVSAFSSSNIALCKYWGKSDKNLNTPNTPSLSISLGGLGTHVQLTSAKENELFINRKHISSQSPIFLRTLSFLELFRHPADTLKIETISTIPVAAGLASSASYFSALVLALSQRYAWDLSLSQLSCLARLGSGSACRSLHSGFVKWLPNKDPFQSYGVPLNIEWPEFCIGLLIFETAEKKISSRAAMLLSEKTSPLYPNWYKMSFSDFDALEQAIYQRNFEDVGFLSEANALALHAVMLSSRPSILYSTPQTIETILKIHTLRSQGLPLYFTQDAGANLKLIFLKDSLEEVMKHFPQVKPVTPF